MDDLKIACAHFKERHKDDRSVIAVGVDGSSVSDQALAVGRSLLRKDRSDKLVMLHVADSSKNYLPQHLSPVNLHHHFVGRAAQLQVRQSARRFNWLVLLHCWVSLWCAF